MWEVIWSRLTVVVLQVPQWQVKFRLLVLLRPTWRSQTCSCFYKTQSVQCATTSISGEIGRAYVESFSGRRFLGAVLPLTRELLAHTIKRVVDCSGRGGGSGGHRSCGVRSRLRDSVHRSLFTHDGGGSGRRLGSRRWGNIVLGHDAKKWIWWCWRDAQAHVLNL